jgi:hypothetical protein
MDAGLRKDLTELATALSRMASRHGFPEDHVVRALETIFAPTWTTDRKTLGAIYDQADRVVNAEWYKQIEQGRKRPSRKSK